jgi:multiple sugar transport system permease protein
MFPAPIERAPRVARIAYRAALFASLAVWLLPLFGVALTSVRSIDDLNRGNLWGWPSEFRLIENYAAVFADSRMAQFIFNSVLIAVPAVAGAVALACMAGFALAKYRFRGNLVLFVIFIAGNLVPFQILMIPVRNLAIDTGIYDTRWALILFHAAFQTGFCTLFMRNFIKQLPDDMLDAARNEGLSELQIFRHIVLPLVRPAIAAIAALTFTFVWNDYFWSLVLVQSDDVRPLTAGLQSLRGMWLASWQLISAGSIVAAIPPVLIFFFMQQHFIAGLTSGSQSD